MRSLGDLLDFSLATLQPLQPLDLAGDFRLIMANVAAVICVTPADPQLGLRDIKSAEHLWTAHERSFSSA